ncbi:DUF4870 domain-containing protein, partial [Candidatus Woesearchaeota archaeon]|nr:DUF4870 domain-containing protein [Candidatus Woesearchaeota archaeon]
MANDESKIFAFLAYLLGIVGFLIVLLAKKDDKYAMYHAKQSLVLFIAVVAGWVAVFIVSLIIGFIPYVGWILSALLSLALWLGFLALWILGMVNALTMKEKPLPVIGQYADKI